jgi:hypothetical protein
MNELSIIRNDLKFEAYYTQIPNEWIRDPRIGFRAKGVLHYLLSHKSGWKTSLEHLAMVGKDGRDAIRTAIIELEENGYLIRTRLRDSGKLSGSEWELIDPFDSPSSGKPMLEKPTQENPMLENPTLKNTNNKKTIDKKTNIKNTSETANQAFESFWKIYPRKTAKATARIAYQKAIDKVNIKELEEAVERYASDPNLPEEQFIPHASTWLNQERWSDGPLPQRIQKPVSSDNARAILERATALQNMMGGGAKELGHKTDGDGTGVYLSD